MSGAQSNFEFDDIVIESPSANSGSLKLATTSVEIFESLEKPYLTGRIEIVDANNLFADLNIQGNERITIIIKSNDENAKVMYKSFYIHQIEALDRINTGAQQLILHLVEDLLYISNLQTISRSYKGSPSSIISDIAQEYLGTTVYSTGKDNGPIKCIIPYLDPIDALMWIRNDATTVEGYPFYLYSSWGNSQLVFTDLGSMLSKQSSNLGNPFLYDPSIANHPLESYRIKNKTVNSFEYFDNENLYKLIDQGLVGSYLDTIDFYTGKKTKTKFNILTDALTPISGILTGNQTNVNYSQLSALANDKDKSPKIAGKQFHNIQSRNITQSRTFKNFDDIPNYGERPDPGFYKQEIISRSLQYLLRKSSLQFQLDGEYFIDDAGSRTLGNTISIRFSCSDPDDERPHDNKLSGDYLIYEARHIFNKEKYDVKLTGTKIANFYL